MGGTKSGKGCDGWIPTTFNALFLTHTVNRERKEEYLLDGEPFRNKIV